MLKWITPKGNQSRIASEVPTTRLTDDPLATINIQAVPDTNRMSYSKSVTSSKHRPEPEPVYAVSRVNPLFVDSREMTTTTNLSDGEKRLMDDSQSSNRSEQCRTPSSSGYESATGGAEKRPITSNHQEQQHKPSHQHVRNYRHHGHHQQHLVELSPASDYRRQFVLGRLDRSPPTNSKALVTYDPDSPCRIGKAHLIRHNPNYVTDIQMSTNQSALQQQETTIQTVPQPVWPARKVSLDRSPNTAAIIKQDQNYVTKILIAPRTADTNPSEGYDSIVTQTLLMLTSYDGKSTDSCPASDTTSPEIESRSSAELAEIRKLSQTISQSRMVATVSRALSKNSNSSGSETYSSRPTAVENQETSGVGGSIAKRISLMKERWEKNSRRRLLVESDDDDIKTYHTLDQRYVPQNGDLNFSSGLNRTSSDNGFLPFSYLSGIQSKTIAEEAVNNDEIRLPNRLLSVPQHQLYGDPVPYDEQDRLSNSSSRSSGSRRVTFSADTVDNEQSSKASSSSGSIAGNDKNKTFHHQTIIQELKLNPQYLPHRYQQSQLVSVGVDRSRLAGYYSHNLQAHNQLSYNEKIKKATENVNVWEHYHDVTMPSSAGSTIVHMEPYGDLQLHPNYGAACPDRLPCMDFTLDGGEVSLLQRRSDNDKLRRRLCCCILLMLCLAVLVVVVIGISLYLSHGQKIFGSVGP